MHKWLEHAVRNAKWSVWFLNARGEWVRFYSSEHESFARKEYTRARDGAYKLYNAKGELVDSKGDDTVIVMG